MKLRVFAVYDEAVKAYMPPFFARSNMEAHRMFSSTVNGQEKSNLNMFPDQFSMFFLGEFDDELGQFNMPTAPQMLTTARQAIVDDKPPAPRSV